ncbi:phosphate transport system permease protein [Propionibacterium cyclohexanicum]|uniref:Phosphate transport system permease protein PstA n=1 Tax=Propionibacterium cyclohexanicum TaxID=64702 RepID=A0A1H9RTU8_9ACTN|nr:phosphate ABC transporter permease PstA [Propionibacterium cyclohexanicum]SER76024.1 phosphate transport system permease protein [Propionibacterium cyclohexanicum]
MSNSTSQQLRQHEPAPTDLERLFSDSLTAARLPRFTSLGLLVLSFAVAALFDVITGHNGLARLAVIGVLLYLIVHFIVARAVEGGRPATDGLARDLVTLAFIVALIPLISLIFETLKQGLVRFDADYFTKSMWGVINTGGGAAHAIQGTLIVTALSTIISVPIGLFTAIYLVEYGHGRLSRAITLLVDVMTGIPSIVAGLFAYSLFVLIVGVAQARMGFTGAVSLCVLMIPYVVRSAEEMLSLVPNSLREASYALGVTKWLTIVRIVIPTALSGIVSGVVIAIARVIGETAPLLITAGFVNWKNPNPFSGEMTTLPVFVYNQVMVPGVPQQPFYDRAWTGALVLILIVMVLNLLGRFISARFSPKTKK